MVADAAAPTLGSPWVTMRAARSCLLLALLAPALAKKGAAPKTPKAPKAPAPKQPPPRRKAKPVVSTLASDTNGADVSLPNLPEFHARGGYLQMNGKRVYVKGISWFGFEGDKAVVVKGEYDRRVAGK